MRGLSCVLDRYRKTSRGVTMSQAPDVGERQPGDIHLAESIVLLVYSTTT